MGGFHFFEEGSPSQRPVELPWLPPHSRPLYPLDVETIEKLIKERTLTLPTEIEIKDRSKSDWLAKSLVLIQTSWFVIQCIARAAAHLPITELELVTLAYATMSFGIYLAWWDKPRNVASPIRVLKKPDAEREGGDNQGESGDSEGNHFVRTHPDDEAPRLGKSRPQWQLWERAESLTWEWLKFCVGYISGAMDEAVYLRDQNNVPMFYSGNPSRLQIGISDISTVLVGALFGAIHCIAWRFEFPSLTEEVLWQVSSITAVSLPASCLCITLLWLLIVGYKLETVLGWLRHPMFIYLPLYGIWYIVARITLLVLAFTCLRALPPGAYENIQWTSYIPHI